MSSKSILHDNQKHSDRSSHWPYDSKFSQSRDDEFLPPYLQDEVQFRPNLVQRSDLEKSHNLPTQVPSNDELKAQIVEYLTFTSAEVAKEVEVKVREGVVNLSGSVSDHWMKLQIEGLAEQIHGVKKVINDIEVGRKSEPLEPMVN